MVVNTIKRFLAILLIAISTIWVQVQVVLGGGTPLNLPFNSLEEYAATNSSIMVVVISQKKLDGFTTIYSRQIKTIMNPRQSLYQLNNAFQAQVQTLFNEMLVGPTDPDFDFSREFRILTYTTGLIGKWGSGSEIIFFLYNYDFVSFVRISGEGDESVYDVPTVHPTLNVYDKIAFHVPGLRWAVQQLYDEEGNFLSYGLKDGKNNPSVEEGWVDPEKELLYVDTRLITGEPQTYKIVLNDGEYRVIDGSGVERPQIIPLRTSITNNHDGTVTVRVLGGDSYRTLLLEESTDFSTWTEIYRVERLPDYYSDQAFQITVPSTSHSFFRVKGL